MSKPSWLFIAKWRPRTATPFPWATQPSSRSRRAICGASPGSRTCGAICSTGRAACRSPALVITTLLSLGLGIGVNMGIFSLAVEFLFSEPSVRDAASLVSIRLGGNSHSSKAVVDFVRASGLFQDVVGENEETYINWDDGAETHQVFSVQVTKNYFTVLGNPIAYGRGILPGDPDEVAVLSNRFWRNHLHGDPAVVGRAIRLDGRSCTIVGILPADFRTLIGF